MKKLYTILSLALSLSLGAQVADRTVTDCSGTTNSIYDVLGQGKVLVVISSGLDCSICMSQAPGHQNWAAQYAGSAEVWGAMTYRYSGATPMCSEVTNWISTYSWNDIFTFVDNGQFWFSVGTPRFTVYDPRDSSIAYQGFQSNTALSTAQNIIGSLSTESVNVIDFEVATFKDHIEIQNWPGKLDIRLISITGKSVVSTTSSDQVKRINTVGLIPGIYLVSIQDGDGRQEVRKIYVN